jgi:hypothetical protein
MTEKVHFFVYKIVYKKVETPYYDVSTLRFLHYASLQSK